MMTIVRKGRLSQETRGIYSCALHPRHSPPLPLCQCLCTAPSFVHGPWVCGGGCDGVGRRRVQRTRHACSTYISCLPFSWRLPRGRSRTGTGRSRGSRCLAWLRPWGGVWGIPREDVVCFPLLHTAGSNRSGFRNPVVRAAFSFAAAGMASFFCCLRRLR